MSIFINLKTFSDYSIGESIVKLPELVRYCKKKSIPAIAITDRNNLFGSLEFSLECIKHGIQPIIGCMINIGIETKSKKKHDFIVILTKNKNGMREIVKLVSICCMRKDMMHIKIKEIIRSSNIIILFNMKLITNIFFYTNKTRTIKIINVLRINLKENLYLEVNREKKDINTENERILINYSRRNNIEIAGTNVIKYINKDNYDALDALISVNKNNYNRKISTNSYLMENREIAKLFSEIPQAIYNTTNIAIKCSNLIYKNEILIPRVFPTRKKESDELIIQSKQGLRCRLKEKKYTKIKKNIYFQRLKHELKIITKMQFGVFFLMVSKYIRWSKKKRVIVGPGRGSAAGSIVAWSLDITDINPIKFGLLFERFLNSERISMPDFDIDFCQEKRDMVIDYVIKKFEKNKVAQIISFGKLQAKGVIRDVGRYLKISYHKVDEICKMIPHNQNKQITLKEAVSLNNKIIDNTTNDSIKRLILISLKLEGINKHTSTHAAGIIISQKKLIKTIALYKDEGYDIPIIQNDLKYSEKLGLIKFDFLGLKTLTVISWANKIVDDRNNNEDTKLRDEKTYGILSRGYCLGIFQFESPGIRENLKQIIPDRIRDLAALASLYRPGPMKNIATYINRRHKREKINSINKIVRSILKETYGIIIYQEQIMRIMQEIAQYTLGEADLLRQAISKKIKNEMHTQKKVFVEKAIDNSIPEKEAEEIFLLIKKFASYGFNKSHAIAYSYISFQTAYLKTNYTIEFIITSINLEIEDTKKIYLIMLEAKKLGITILLPNINYSSPKFMIMNNHIRFGLNGIKGVESKTIENIIEDRTKNGKYKNIFDFIIRLSKNNLNKKTLESLINTGTLDTFNFNRKTLFMNVKKIVKKISNSNFFIAREVLKNNYLKSFEEWNSTKKDNLEFRHIGYNTSNYVLRRYKLFLKILNMYPYCNFIEELNMKDKKNITGIIITKKIKSRKDVKYVFIQICNLDGIVCINIFNKKVLEKIQKVIFENNIICLKVLIKKENALKRVLIENIMKIEDIINKSNIEIIINIKTRNHLEYLSNNINYNEGIKINSMNNEYKKIVTKRKILIDYIHLKYFEKQQVLEYINKKSCYKI